MLLNGIGKPDMPLILVCDDKDVSYANYLIQLIGQKDDKENEVIGIVDDSVSAAIYTTKFYQSNLPQIPSKQHILFIGHSSVAKEQRKSITNRFSMFGMHYGWLGKRAVLYVDDTNSEWIKIRDSRKHYDGFLEYSRIHGIEHEDALYAYSRKVGSKLMDMVPVVVGASKMLIDRNRTLKDITEQQYRTLEKVFYDEGLRLFMEG